MELVLAIVVGTLFTAGVYLMLRRSVVRLIVGLALISQGANLLIFTAGGLTRAEPAIIPPGLEAPAAAVADPLPQALILTAIVISFGVTAFAMALASKAFRAVGTDDTGRFVETDR